MSQHEIEDLVEHSVKVLDRSDVNGRLVRDLIASLYRFQQYFDCGYTHRRVHEILVRRRSLLELPLGAHPDRARFAALFARLDDQKAGWLTPGALGEVAGMSAPGEGRRSLWATTAESTSDEPDHIESDLGGSVFFMRGKLQLDVGSPLWERMHARNAFTGVDAEAPQRFAPHQMAAFIVKAAVQAQDRELISWWYAALPAFILTTGEPADVKSLCEDADIDRMLAVVEAARAFELRSDWGLLQVPRAEELAEHSEEMQAFTSKWFRLSWSLPPQRDRTTVVLQVCAELTKALEAGERPGAALTRAVHDLGEFQEWSSFLSLFQYGFRYRMSDRDFTARIKRVIDFSGATPAVDEAKADAELSLQQ